MARSLRSLGLSPASRGENVSRWNSLQNTWNRRLSSSISVRSFVSYGSGVSIFETLDIGRSLSVLEFTDLGSSLSLRSGALMSVKAAVV